MAYPGKASSTKNRSKNCNSILWLRDFSASSNNQNKYNRYHCRGHDWTFESRLFLNPYSLPKSLEKQAGSTGFSRTSTQPLSERSGRKKFRDCCLWSSQTEGSNAKTCCSGEMGCYALGQSERYTCRSPCLTRQFTFNCPRIPFLWVERNFGKCVHFQWVLLR